MGEVFKKSIVASLIVVFYISSGCLALASDKLIRWTGSEDPDGTLDHVIQVVNQKVGRTLTLHDFSIQEDRDLAFNHYKRLVQLIDQVPVHGKSIRIWTELNSNKAIQVEADLELPSSRRQRGFGWFEKTTQELQKELSSELTNSLARESVTSDLDDPNIQGISWKDEWQQGQLLRTVKVRGKRGYHFVHISLHSKRVISRDYREFPRGDAGEQELSIPVQVYPIYEEVETDGTILPRVPAVLRHIHKQVPKVTGDIYAPLRSQRYLYSKYNPVLGETEAGRASGYWSPRYLKAQAAKLRETLPFSNNDWTNGVLLQGSYATINIHPDAIQLYTPGELAFQKSSPLFLNWIETQVNGKDDEELIPGTAYYGKPIYSLQEAWDRPARRLADHDPKSYLNDGFDEIQVYYAVDTLFEELHARGFIDPDLSTRPFNAFLFNPDIAYRDNAYYTDDTINFTTYSSKAGNMARDNSTIWHELGHGIMDRLMGDNIELADTGGLSEGMADFVAAMVVQAVTEGTSFPGSRDFRIINKTGFYLTNEVHDDGESYGGAMKDFLDAAISKFGQKGLHKVADVVLEGMRLTRDHPGLSAPEWFKHVLFADSLGRPGIREPNELGPLLLPALAGRNFKLDGGEVASFSIVNLADHKEITPTAPGSRGSPIPVIIEKTGQANFEIEAAVKSSNEFAFQYPVQIRVKFKGGALQGAVHWIGEEKGPQVYTLNSESETIKIPLQVSGVCDEVNRTDGSCVDYAYIQVWNQGEAERPTAKKRFYLRVKNPS